MSTDFRDGVTFPRRGRQPLRHFLWLARVIDKARAAESGTLADYVHPCPIDQGMFDRWGITAAQFADVIRTNPGDEAVVEWLSSIAGENEAAFANHWLVIEKVENLDRQDREEGAFALVAASQ